MLTTEMRQSLMGLMMCQGICSVDIRDFRGADEKLRSNVFIHAMDDVSREEILDLIHGLGVSTIEKTAHAPREDGKQAFPYELIIEGADRDLSNLFFDETVKEKAPTSIEATEENTLLNGITEWTIEEIMRREG